MLFALPGFLEFVADHVEVGFVAVVVGGEVVQGNGVRLPAKVGQGGHMGGNVGAGCGKPVAEDGSHAQMRSVARAYLEVLPRLQSFGELAGKSQSRFRAFGVFLEYGWKNGGESADRGDWRV